MTLSNIKHLFQIPLTVKLALIDSSKDQTVTCFKVAGKVV
jgi:hypothetical protein